MTSNTQTHSMPAKSTVPVRMSARDRRRVVGGAVLGDQIVIDGEFGHEMVVHGAQPLDTDVDRVAVTFEPGDFVVQLRGEALHDFAVGHGLDCVFPDTGDGAGARGEAQGMATEQDDGRGSWLPAQGGVVAQQRADQGCVLIGASPNFCQGVASGAAAARDFFFGQVQLRDTRINEVDKSVDAVGGDCHTPHPTALNAQYPTSDFRCGYVSDTTVRLAA